MKTNINPIDLHVGKRVRLRRILLGMSQTMLAERSGITFQQVQKYEKGTNRISASRLQEFADVLRVEPAYFFEDQPNAKRAPPREETPVERLLRSDDGIALARAFAGIGGKVARRSALAAVKAIGEAGP